MGTDQGSFSIAMRGYNRDDVDRTVLELRSELTKATNERAEAVRELKRLSSSVHESETETDKTGAPSASGLGSKLESMLRLAEEQARQLISQTDSDADRVRTAVQAEVHQLRLDAVSSAQLLAVKAKERAEGLVAAARGRGRESPRLCHRVRGRRRFGGPARSREHPCCRNDRGRSGACLRPERRFSGDGGGCPRGRRSPRVGSTGGCRCEGNRGPTRPRRGRAAGQAEVERRRAPRERNTRGREGPNRTRPRDCRYTGRARPRDRRRPG